MSSKRTDLYKSMLLGRHLEEGLAALFREGNIYGNLHLGVGEEAVAVGGVEALAAQDYLFQSHRGVAGVIHRGVDLHRIAAQALGRASGLSRGRSDIVHLADRSRNVMGVSGTIGGNFALALGSAWASKYRGDDAVTLCCFGDGAMNRGTFLESVNMMTIWKAPVVLLCDNNGYAVSAAITDMFAGDGLAARAASFGIPATTVDGNDLDQVLDACSEAVDRARNGHGPSFIEATTYRLRGHFEGDAQNYRAANEAEAWRGKDPLPRFREKLEREGCAASELDALEAVARGEVEAALDAALAAPLPDPASVTEGVYA